MPDATLAATLADGRHEAIALMVDTVTLQHAGTGPVFSTETGTTTGTAGTAYYTGIGEVRELSTAQSRNAGDEVISGASWMGRLPVTVDGIVDGDILTVTASPDPDLVGTSFRVMFSPPSANRTARRLALQRNG